MNQAKALLEPSYEISCGGRAKLAMERREKGPALLRRLACPKPEGAIGPDAEPNLGRARLVRFGVGVEPFRRLRRILLEFARNGEGLGAVAKRFAPAPERL
jgi:hypothetical protein